MLKRLSRLLVAVLSTLIASKVAVCDPCKSLTEIWPGDDPHVHYYCGFTSPETAVMECCRQGTGFISNGTFKGCVNWLDWSDNCIGKEQPTVAMCDGFKGARSFGYGDPSHIYFCIKQGSAPQQFFCQDGTGYYKKSDTGGCYAWKTWRELTGCVNGD